MASQYDPALSTRCFVSGCAKCEEHLTLQNAFMDQTQNAPTISGAHYVRDMPQAYAPAYGHATSEFTMHTAQGYGTAAATVTAPAPASATGPATAPTQQNPATGTVQGYTSNYGHWGHTQAAPPVTSPSGYQSGWTPSTARSQYGTYTAPGWGAAAPAQNAPEGVSAPPAAVPMSTHRLSTNASDEVVGAFMRLIELLSGRENAVTFQNLGNAGFEISVRVQPIRE